MSTQPALHSEPRLRYPEAALYLHITERQLRRWVSERKISFVKIGNATEFTLAMLDEALAARTFSVTH